MSLDRFISDRRELATDNYQLTSGNFDSHVERRFEYYPDSKRLHILMPPWRGKLAFTDELSKFFRKKRRSFLTYEFPNGILSSDHQTTIEFFRSIEGRVNSDVEGLKGEYGFTDFDMTGMSLGCVNSTMIANRNPIYGNMTLLVPGHCLAESMWSGYRTQHLRQEFEERGVSEEQLIDEWSELAPMNNIGGLKDSKVAVFLSTADEIIPYRCGEKLVEKLREGGIKPKVRNLPFLGHYGVSTLFYKVPNLFIK